MPFDTHVHRYEVQLDQGAVLFRALAVPGGPAGPAIDWAPEVTIECVAGRHVILFELVSGSEARFSSAPIHWLQRDSELGDFQPMPTPACMRVQRDGDSRLAVWNDNLNLPLEAGSDEVYGFAVALVGPEGVVVGSSDPTVVNKPDPGPGGPRRTAPRGQGD